MSSNPIDDLPTELLCQVFDYLNHQQQLTAKLACVRWCNILSSDQYIRHSRLILSSSNLCKANGTSIQQMKRYRAFKIKDSKMSNRNQFLQALRKFLSCKEVSDNVEELRLDLHWFTISDLFASGRERFYMPRLRQIGLYPRNRARNVIRYQLRAPNLRNVLIGDACATDTSLTESFRDQIELLDVTNVSQLQFFELFGAATFAYLRNLTLSAGYGGFFRGRDFTTAHLQMFGQLRYLKIVDNSNLFYLAYRSIFQAAKNLRTLSIQGINMTEEAFGEISRIVNLKELTLMVYIELSSFSRKLSLPQLEQLTTFYGTLAPLGRVPKLRSLTVRNPTHFGERYIRSKKKVLANYLKLLCQNRCLEILALDEVEIDKTAVSHICTFINLKSLRMAGVDIDQTDVRRIVTTLKNLEYLRIERCFLENDVYCAKTKDMSFFSGLRYLNGRCQISDIDNRIAKSYRSAPVVIMCLNLVVDSVIFFWFLVLIILVYVMTVLRKVLSSMVR